LAALAAAFPHPCINDRRPIPVEAFFAWLNGIIWSNALIALCLGAGLWFTIRTRVMQVRGFAEMCRLTVTGQKSDAGVSSFQALAISMAGRMGIGNIAGVATAIAYGGPGAVFWMWVMGFLGASTSYIECTLAQIYKEKDGEGRYRGGPAYYIEKAMGLKWYAVTFAVATVIATGLLLPGVQANAIADSATNVLCGMGDCAAVGGTGALKLWIGLGVAAVLAVIIFGGIKRIATFAEVVVPFMALAFILMAVIVMIANAGKVPAMFADIFSSAFGAHAAFGAIIGQAIAWGVKRGIYANEAGQGTGPHAAAAAEVSHPAKQGYVQAFAIYFDTMLVCTSTAFLLLSTGMYNTFKTVSENGKDTLVEIFSGVPGLQPSEGAQFTQAAVESVLPGWGAGFVALALFFFAFTTIMAYYYMAETNLTYLAGVKKTHPLATLLLRLGIVGMVVFGAYHNAAMAWTLGDIGVGLMAWLNVIAILILQKPALIALRDYERQKKQGLDPTFDPEALGIRNAHFWKKQA
jgi:AGCS family alanine or glycine:cation symporter